MEAPRMTKTREKPATKLRVCRKIYRRLGGLAVKTELPAMLAIYTGTSGRTHGDRKDNNPAANATGNVMLGICTSPGNALCGLPP